MRVLEHGLRALAKDVGRNFDVQNWQNIIDEIESEIRHLSKSLPRGIQKNERIQFLSEAAKEFMYFKDGWRNHVSHGRGDYDEHQARSIMEHVRSFMTVLSAQLSE
jgi:predicted outer membrane protein